MNKKLKIFAQLLTDEENQPHQFMGNETELAKDILTAVEDDLKDLIYQGARFRTGGTPAQDAMSMFVEQSFSALREAL